MHKFKLINQSELEFIRQRLVNAVNNIISERLLKSIEVNVVIATTEDPIELAHAMLFSVDNASIIIPDITLVKKIFTQALFAETVKSILVDEVILETLQVLLSNLLLHKIQQSQIEIDCAQWCKRGGGALKMLLNIGEDTIILFSSPESVKLMLTEMEKGHSPQEKLDKLSNALPEQTLDIQTELDSINLTLTDLKLLNKGHVIVTDHVYSKPVQVKYKNKAICEANIGIYENKKAIQLQERK